MSDTKVLGQEREMKDYPNKPGDLREYDISTEAWREYDFGGRIYRIEKPQKLFLRVGGTTHRVVDKDGVVHCLPTVGQGDCVLRWQNFDTEVPVNF